MCFYLCFSFLCTKTCDRIADLEFLRAFYTDATDLAFDPYVLYTNATDVRYVCARCIHVCLSHFYLCFSFLCTKMCRIADLEFLTCFLHRRNRLRIPTCFTPTQPTCATYVGGDHLWFSPPYDQTYTSHVSRTCLTSYTSHTSDVRRTRHTSHVSHHASHVSRHTSRVTRLTSHEKSVTRLTSRVK
jgi:hypothetical protein